MKTRIAVAAVLLGAVAGALAQNTGELWEITTQMNVPGMPAGMSMPGMGGARRVCGGDDPERAQQDSKRDCKVTDRKQSGNRMTMTITCKDGTSGTIDHQYNAGRTEFKSTMSMKSRDGDMQMVTNGRKVGTCDAVAERKKQEAQIEDTKKQAAAGAAASAAAAATAYKQAEDNQIKTCAASLEKMQPAHLNLFRECQTTKKEDRQCQALLKTQPEAAKACSANAAEFCRRFPTAEGYLRTGQKEEAAKMCGVTTASIIATQCPRVAKTQSPLAFLGAYCPVEAKPIAMEHCGGRDYTSKMGGKYAAFCERYLANADFERPPGAASAPQRTQVQGQQPQGQQTQEQQQPQSGTDQVKQGVSKGIDKLRGLFGR